MLQATNVAALRQPFNHRSFASGSAEVDKALDKATKSNDAHKLLEVRQEHVQNCTHHTAVSATGEVAPACAALLFAMVQVVEKHGNEFKESDVVTTFLTIADWDHTTGNHEVLQSKPFQTLVGTSDAFS